MFGPSVFTVEIPKVFDAFPSGWSASTKEAVEGRLSYSAFKNFVAI
jgi:hypothetical protein